MEDTPNYPTVKNFFDSFNVSDFTRSNDGLTSLSEIEVELSSIVAAIKYYISNDDFRGSIPFNIRNDLDSSHIQSLINFINNIISDRGSPPNFPAQKQSRIVNEFRPSHQTLFEVIYKPYLAYLASIEDGKEKESRLKKAMDAYQSQAASINQLFQRVRDESSEFQKTHASLLKKVNANLTASDLGDYFHKLYNGNTLTQEVKRQEKLLKVSKSDSEGIDLKARMAILLFLAFTLSIGIGPKLPELAGNTKEHRIGFIQSLSALTLLVLMSVISTLYVYRKTITRAVSLYRLRSSSYQSSANAWVFAAIIFSLVAALIGVVVIKMEAADGQSITWEEIALRAGILLAPAYLARISMANYRANRHQAVLYRHRATVFNNLVGLENTINTNENSPEMKKLYSDVTAFMFAMNDTGFLNKDQGAGSNDDMFDAFRGMLRG
jgi:hypothetical protein